MVLKGQGFQDKHHAKPFINFVSGKVRIMEFETLQEIPEDMLDKATHLNGSARFLIHAKLKMAIHEKTNIKTSPAQKELEDCQKNTGSMFGFRNSRY